MACSASCSGKGLMSVEDSNVSLALMAEFLIVLVNKWQRIYKGKKKPYTEKVDFTMTDDSAFNCYISIKCYRHNYHFHDI